jgi:hypothetical protein
LNPPGKNGAESANVAAFLWQSIGLNKVNFNRDSHATPRTIDRAATVGLY